MTDFNTPTNTTTYTSVLSTINDKISSVAKMLFSSDTNIPTGTLQYNRTTRLFEEWNGSSWVTMQVEQAGVIKAFGGSSAPSGHLLCNGAAVSRTTYAALFAAIGTTYGIGDGSTTFNLPNLKGRFPLGKSDAGTGSSLGAAGGAIDHTHTVKAHYHGMGAGATLNITSSGGGGVTDYAPTGISLGDTNINHTHSGSTNDGQGAHFHDAIEAATADSGAGTIDNIRITGGTQVNTTIDNVILSTGSEHVHTFTSGLMNSNAIHNHTVSDPQHRHGTQNHTHGAANFAGSIGLVTGGVDGNVAQATLDANPPFQVVNYIISI